MQFDEITKHIHKNLLFSDCRFFQTNFDVRFEKNFWKLISE